MTEKQLWDQYGEKQKDQPFCFGPYYSYQLRNTPRRIIFMLSHYKFASKMIGPGKKVLELGCNEGLGSYYLSEFAEQVLGVDFDQPAIEWATANLASPKLAFTCGDFLGRTFGQFDAVVSNDVIEHIYPENETTYLGTLTANLSPTGICLVGTPNQTAERYSNPDLAGAHVNMYTAQRLVDSLQGYFHNVFLFGANDEMVHTGYPEMCHYLLALCTHKK